MDIPIWAIQFLAGGMGGLVRGIVGVTKAQTFNPDTFKFQWKYFAITIIVSMIVGQTCPPSLRSGARRRVAGLIANADWRMSLLAGYAGSDFLESMYRLSAAKFFKVG